MGTNNNNLYRVAKWIWVLSWYILFPGQKYLSSIVVFHSLLPERPFYCQSSLPCKPFYLNFGYRCLQLLYPWCTYHKYISHIFIIKSNSKGGEPLTFSATGKFGGDWGIAAGKQSQERKKELEWLIIILLERFDELSDETADKLAADLLELFPYPTDGEIFEFWKRWDLTSIQIQRFHSDIFKKRLKLRGRTWWRERNPDVMIRNKKQRKNSSPNKLWREEQNIRRP